MAIVSPKKVLENKLFNNVMSKIEVEKKLNAELLKPQNLDEYNEFSFRILMDEEEIKIAQHLLSSAGYRITRVTKIGRFAIFTLSIPPQGN